MSDYLIDANDFIFIADYSWMNCHKLLMKTESKLHNETTPIQSLSVYIIQVVILK